MSGAYATVDDVIALKRAVTNEERGRLEEMLTIISDRLRYEADKRGRDLDAMIEVKPYLAGIAKSITVDIAMRELNTSTEAEPMSQITQSALGYSVSGTYLVPGGGLFIKDNELKALGLIRQKYGVMEFYECDQGNAGNPLSEI